MLIDTYQFLQEELQLVKEFEHDTRLLATKLVKERTSTYTSFSDCNIMRVALHHMENSNKANELYQVLKSEPAFQGLLENLLLSKDSEDLKYSFHFLQQTVGFEQDKDVRKVWSESVNLLSTLDSFGKYLIEPQWISVVGQLLTHLETKDPTSRSSCDLFWVFKILSTKAMKHDNPLVVKFAITNLLEQDLNLNIYIRLLLDVLIPLLDNGKLYEDVGLSPDVHPKLADYLSEFFTKAGGKYSQVLSEHYQELAERITAVDSFNGKACVWHIFGGLFQSKSVSASSFDTKVLEKIVLKAVDIAQNYPAYRKSLYTDDFVSFITMLPQSFEVWRASTKYFLAESLQETFFHSETTNTRLKYLKYLLGHGGALWTQILKELTSFFTGLSTTLKAPADGFKECCWTVRFFCEMRTHLDAGQLEALQQLDQLISKQLFEAVELLDDLTGNPYAKSDDLSNTAVVSMRTVAESLPQLGSLLVSEPTALKTVLHGVLAATKLPADVREHLEPLLHELKRAIGCSDPKIVDVLHKCLKTALQTLSGFLEEPYSKETEILEQTKTRRAESGLTVINHLTSWLIENSFESWTEDVLALMAKLNSQVLQRNTVRMDHQIKSLFVVFEEFISGKSTKDKALAESYISDCTIFSLVTKFSRAALNKISQTVVIPQFRNDQQSLTKFFKVMIDTVEKLRNSPLAYYIFESFMCFGFESLDQEQASLLSDQLIKVCEIDNAAFRLRKISTLICKFVVSHPQYISRITKLID